MLSELGYLWLPFFGRVAGTNALSSCPDGFFQQLQSTDQEIIRYDCIPGSPMSYQ